MKNKKKTKMKTKMKNTMKNTTKRRRKARGPTDAELIKRMKALEVSGKSHSKTLAEIPEKTLGKLVSKAMEEKGAFDQDAVNNIVLRIKTDSTFTKFREAINKTLEFEKIYVKHVKDLMNILLSTLYDGDNLEAWFNNYILMSRRLARKKHYLQINKQKLIEVIKPLEPYIVGDITPLIESYKILEQLYDYIPKFEAATSAPGASRAKIKGFQKKIQVFKDKFKKQSPQITFNEQSILDNHANISKFKQLVDKFHVVVLKIMKDVHEIREENKTNLVTRRREGYWSKSNSPYSSPAEQ